MANKLNWKTVKYWMDEWHPYNNNGDSDTYNKLWESIRTLAALNFEPANDIFIKMVDYDNKLFLKDN